MNNDINDKSLLDDDQDDGSVFNNDEDTSLLSDEDSSLLLDENQDISSNETDNTNINEGLNEIKRSLNENSAQLNKLDQLEQIKIELQKFNENKDTSSNVVPSNQKYNNHPDLKDISDRVDAMEEQVSVLEKAEELYKQKYASLEETIGKINNINESISELKDSNESYSVKINKLEETIARFEEIEKDLEVEYVEENTSKKPKKDKKNNNPEEKNNNLAILLLVLILLFAAVFVIDFMGIINLYISESILKLF